MVEPLPRASQWSEKGPAGENFDHAIREIEVATIRTDPFAHILIDALFPDDFFAELLTNFPPRDSLTRVTYPGTGYGRVHGERFDYGLSCLDFSDIPTFADLERFFQSDRFARVLLEKFSKPGDDGTAPIPQSKNQYFVDGASDFKSVCNLHIDLPGYEIPPHRDVSTKVVTFQHYLVSDDSLRDYGTIFCKPRNGHETAKRSRLAKQVGRCVKTAAKLTATTNSAAFHRLAETQFALWSGMAVAHWLPWSLFDDVIVTPALPNHFMAFAPGRRTYHGVRFDPPAGAVTLERRVMRGFILAGSDAQNWVQEAHKGQYR